MSWINIIFIAVLCNAVCGTLAYPVLCVLTKAAIRFKTVQIVYPLYKLFQAFCIVPGCAVLCGFMLGFTDGRLPDIPVLRIAFYTGCAVWAVGTASTFAYSVQNYKKELWFCSRNLPLTDPRYREVLEDCYPCLRGRKIMMSTNFLVGSPCVVGVFRHHIVLPETDYTEEELRTILMHEGAHILKMDNLVKRIGISIAMVNWFHPYLRRYKRELAEWAETACDITVCKKFFKCRRKHYFQILYRVFLKGSGLIPASAAGFDCSGTLRRRIERISRWNLK